MNNSEKTKIIRNKNVDMEKEKGSQGEKSEKNFSPYYKKKKIHYKSVFCIIELLSQKKYL